jgi:hypothetical protein
MRPAFPASLVQEDQAMKTILLSLTAAAALAAAVAPAVAQPYGAHQPYAPAYSAAPARPVAAVDRLDWRIGNSVREHRISWQEARDLRAQLRDVRPIAYRVESGRASGWERQRLDRTLARVEVAVSRYADNDRHDGDRHDWRR